MIGFYVNDVKLFLSAVFDKYNTSHKGSNGPSISGCADAVCGLLSYEKWLKDKNPAGEVLAAKERI